MESTLVHLVQLPVSLSLNEVEGWKEVLEIQFPDPNRSLTTLKCILPNHQYAVECKAPFLEGDWSKVEITHEKEEGGGGVHPYPVGGRRGGGQVRSSPPKSQQAVRPEVVDWCSCAAEVAYWCSKHQRVGCLGQAIRNPGHHSSRFLSPLEYHLNHCNV